MWCRCRVSSFDHPKYDEVWVMVHEDVTDQVRAEDEYHRLTRELDRLRANNPPGESAPMAPAAEPSRSTGPSSSRRPARRCCSRKTTRWRGR